MRFIIITDQFPPAYFGGMAQHANHLARYLSRNHNVLVITLRDNNIATSDTSEEFAVRPLLTKRFPKYDFWQINRLARDFKADVIHSCTAGLVDDRLAKQFPVVSRVVGNDFIRPWCGYYLPLRSWLFRLPSKKFRSKLQHIENLRRRLVVMRYLRAHAYVVANSNWTRERLIEEGVCTDRTKLIIGGVNTQVFKPVDEKSNVRRKLGLPEKNPLIMTAGNLIGKKGFDTILHALSILIEKYNILYVVVGDGPENKKLRNLADKLGVTNHVIFAGSKSQVDLAYYYQASDIYVQISRNQKLSNGSEDIETMGRTYFEAGACGIPVIGARVGGVSDVIQHNVNGLLVDDSQNINEITEYIRCLLDNSEFRWQLGRAGLKRAREEFSWQAVCRLFEQLLEKTQSNYI